MRSVRVYVRCEGRRVQEDARPRASRVVNKRRRAKLLASGNHVQLGLRGVHPTRCNSMSSDRGRGARISDARWSAKENGGTVSEMPRRERRAREKAFLHTPSTAACLPGAARPGSTFPLPMIHRRGRADVTLTEDKATRDALLSALADPMLWRFAFTLPKALLSSFVSQFFSSLASRYSLWTPPCR